MSSPLVITHHNNQRERHHRPLTSPDVSICLCTFRRESVVMTLLSLATQRLAPSTRLEVIVVDSDSEGSARTRVDDVRKDCPFPVQYVVAQRPGVAEARNAAIRASSGLWLAFIDDDETAHPDWLSTLLRCAHQHSAQVVFGKVRTHYPEACPDWIRYENLFGKQLPATGTHVTHGATCNALVARSALERLTSFFDPAYGATGGEDTEFFYRLSKRGIVMVTCREAEVQETIEPKRLTSEFLLQKAVRVGETYFRIFFGNASRPRQSALLVRAFLQWVAASAIALCLRPLGLGNSMRYRIKAAANFGKLRAAAGCDAVRLYGS